MTVTGNTPSFCSYMTNIRSGINAIQYYMYMCELKLINIGLVSSGNKKQVMSVCLRDSHFIRFAVSHLCKYPICIVASTSYHVTSNIAYLLYNH